MNNCSKVNAIKIKECLFDFSKPRVMGIVNVTPDSFYSGSRTPVAEAISDRVHGMVQSGVDIFDVGAYSTRPGALEVSDEEEMKRLETALKIIRKNYPDIPTSVDTFRANVAKRCVQDWEVDIINDISGGIADDKMFETVANLNVPYILMHMRGTPQTMSRLCDYNDVTAEVIADLASKLAQLQKDGVSDVIIDPGFGFAKNLEQNYVLLREMKEFKKLGCPILAGLSRKSMIYKALGNTPEQALTGTIALNTIALLNGADILRVHDVEEAKQVVELVQFYENSKG